MNISYCYKAGSVLLLISFLGFGCKKLVEIKEPINSITTSETFSNDATATSALTGIYNYLDFSEKCLNAAYTGLSSDELILSGSGELQQFQTNTLLSTNSSVSLFWTTYYFTVYSANAVLDGLDKSSTITTTTAKQLKGEAKFLRAFSLFQLLNLYGDVPLTTSIDWEMNRTMSRTSSTLIYQQIINDLQDADNLLNDWYVKADNTPYPINAAERVRANRYAAMALLAKVYLYNNKPDSAEALATRVINNPNYSLVTNLNNVFNANSAEAIWQIQPGISYSPYTTYLGSVFIPINNTTVPGYYLTSQLLNAFQQGDARKTAWLNKSIVNSRDTFYYPYKYKIRLGTVNVLSTEYSMILRLAEQYLIRAEARAQQNNLSGAISDINIIRGRANLPALSNSLTKDQVLAAVAQERRIELFAERGDRWFDLKRTGQASTVLGSISYKQPWSDNALLYPIPFSELQRAPNLIQNSGY